MTNKTSPPPTFSVEVSRTINAAPETVFRAWTDPEWFSKWFSATQLVMDPTEGGLFFYEVNHENRLWAHYGRFLDVCSPEKLLFTWMSEATHGFDTQVLVTFKAVNIEGKVLKEFPLKRSQLQPK